MCVYTCNAIQSLKEGNPAACDNTVEPGGQCAEWAEQVPEGHTLRHSNYVRLLGSQTCRNRGENGGCQGTGGRRKWGVVVQRT